MTSLALPPAPKTVPRMLLLCAAAVAVAIYGLHWDLDAVASFAALRTSWARLLEFLAGFGAPDLSAATVAEAALLALETLAVALLGVALGLLLAWPLALGAARCIVLGRDPHPALLRWPLRLLLEGCRLLLDVLRGVPDFAWALMIANFTGVGAPAGVLAIGISVAGILGKVLSEQWDNVDAQHYDALRSTGAGRLQVFLYGVQPLSARSMLSFVLMRTECAIRNASVIGVIGGGGLGAGLYDAFKDSRYGVVVTLLLAMLALTASADVAANFLRYQLRVDPNHPRAARATGRAASARRRTVGVAVGALLLAGSLALLWPKFVALAGELSRLDWTFSWQQYARRLLLQPDLSLTVPLTPQAPGDPTWEWGAVPLAAFAAFVPLAVALLATLAATLAAGVLAYPASLAFQLQAGSFTGEQPTRLQRARRWAIVVGTRGAGLLCRGVPEVAWLLILGAFFRQGLLAGVLAIALHSTGVLLRVFAETIDNVPFRRLEQVSGASRPQIFLYGAVPTAWPDAKTYALFQFEVNVRMGLVLGMIGAGGLGQAFDSNMHFGELHRASTYLWAMVALTVLIDRSSRWLQLRRNRCC